MPRGLVYIHRRAGEGDGEAPDWAPSASEKRRLCGLMSQCTTLAACMAETASRSCLRTHIVSSSVSFRLGRACVGRMEEVVGE